ncbi:UNVERIFIED_ORG: TetR family transcriptional regulator [Nocardia globerula]|uniref:TetR family transcriptional regulator n=1 Tax=Nocardia globerula TaxID=1818 RepID=A0A652YT87_NOCGL|nr:TetR/AcrR family transcriptional regulator [Rhodococcus globerulus]NMD61372.1 TetR/AcrR family transcriptional regulator [Nocardia globerula]PVX67078.1 TetR family transcriptional regulator [Rhodococcus globerulus]
MQNTTSDSQSPAVVSRASQAADRRTARQRQSAADEVERLLAVTLDLIEKSAPAIPSVSAIVAAAGISNQTLYRSFPSKDDLILAVLEQGTDRVASNLKERMAGVDDPQEKILVWTRGVLRQVSDTGAAQISRSVLEHLHKAGSSSQNGSQEELLRPITALLVEPLVSLGCNADLDGPCIADLVLGAMRRHLWSSTAPTRDEIEWIGRFALGGLHVQ